MGKGFFVVRFYSKEDYIHVLTEGPWIILGHYLKMSKWRPNFPPFFEAIYSIMVWIRLPELPIEFFNEELLLRIRYKLGKAL